MNLISEYTDRLQKHLSCFHNLLKSNMNKKRLLIISIIIVAITGISGYLIGNSLSSSEAKFLLKLQNMLDSKDPYKALKHITIENNAIEVNKENLSHFFEYLKDNTGRSRKFTAELSENNTNNTIAVLRREKRWYGSIYKIELKPVFLSIPVQYKDTEISINQKVYTSTKEDNETINIGPLVPGIYTVKALLKSPYGEIFEEKDLLALNKNNNLSFNIKAIKITIDSNFDDASIYINSIASGRQAKDFKDIGPIPLEESIIAYAEKTFPWGIARSSEIEINSTSKVRLDINPLTEELKQQLESVYDKFYNSLFYALTEETKEFMTNCTEQVRDDIYLKLKKETIIIKNSYSITDMDFEQDVISLSSDSNSFTAIANITVSYKEQKRLFIIDLPSYNTVTKKFKTTLTYDSKYDNWKVSQIEEMTAIQ